MSALSVLGQCNSKGPYKNEAGQEESIEGNVRMKKAEVRREKMLHCGFEDGKRATSQGAGI